jgi:hypothetical protein
MTLQCRLITQFYSAYVRWRSGSSHLIIATSFYLPGWFNH